MSELITKLLDGEIADGLDQLEEISQTMKTERLKAPAAPIKDHVKTTPTETLAKAQWKLLKVRDAKVNTSSFVKLYVLFTLYGQNKSDQTYFNGSLYSTYNLHLIIHFMHHLRNISGTA